MKILIILFSLLTVNAHAKKITSSTLQGKVLAQNCNGPAQIWISQKSTLLYQAEAPLNATLNFIYFRENMKSLVTQLIIVWPNRPLLLPKMK